MTKEYYFPNEDVTLRIENPFLDSDINDIDRLFDIRHNEENREDFMFRIMRVCCIAALVCFLGGRVLCGSIIPMELNTAPIKIIGICMFEIGFLFVYGIIFNFIFSDLSEKHCLRHDTFICKYLSERNKEKAFNISGYVRKARYVLGILQRFDDYWQSGEATGKSVRCEGRFIIVTLYMPDNDSLRFCHTDLPCYKDILNLQKDTNTLEPGTVIVYSLPEMEGHIVTGTGPAQIPEIS